MTTTEDFFLTRKPPAVYKHGVLRRYAHVYGGKAGLTTGRVTFLDGYAGEGKYGDNQAPGSPLIFLEAAAALASTRQVTCIFVEESRQRYKKLLKVVQEHAHPDTKVICRHGSIDDHLDEALVEAEGSALLAFLDPFGAAVGFHRVRRILARPEYPPTEVLLHWSLGSVRREGGVSRKVVLDNTYTRTAFPKLDGFLNGGWWRTRFDGIPKDQVHAVSEGIAIDYAEMMTDHTGFTYFHAPVRDQPDHKPKYNLMLFTASEEGVWEFADACSYAWVEWNEAVARENREKTAVKAAKDQLKAAKKGIQLDLFAAPPEEAPKPPGFDRAMYELTHEDSWISVISNNITSLLAIRPAVRLIDHTAEVYGPTIGMARTKHVRAAVKRLYREGALDDNGVDDKGRDEFHKRPVKRLA